MTKKIKDFGADPVDKHLGFEPKKLEDVKLMGDTLIDVQQYERDKILSIDNTPLTVLQRKTLLEELRIECEHLRMDVRKRTLKAAIEKVDQQLEYCRRKLSYPDGLSPEGITALEDAANMNCGALGIYEKLKSYSKGEKNGEEKSNS